MATGDKNYDIAKETTSQEILNVVGSGIGVKSIQRGSVTISTNGGTVKTETVTIEAVNPNKSLLLVQHGYHTSGYSSEFGSAIGEIVDETTLKFTATATNITNWQVIEFY